MDPANTELAMMPTVKNRREDKAVILRLHLIGYSSQSNFKLIVESFLRSHLFFSQLRLLIGSEAHACQKNEEKFKRANESGTRQVKTSLCRDWFKFCI